MLPTGGRIVSRCWTRMCSSVLVDAINTVNLIKAHLNTRSCTHSNTPLKRTRTWNAARSISTRNAFSKNRSKRTLQISKQPRRWLTRWLRHSCVGCTYSRHQSASRSWSPSLCTIRKCVALGWTSADMRPTSPSLSIRIPHSLCRWASYTPHIELRLPHREHLRRFSNYPICPVTQLLSICPPRFFVLRSSSFHFLRNTLDLLAARRSLIISNLCSFNRTSFSCLFKSDWPDWSPGRAGEVVPFPHPT